MQEMHGRTVTFIRHRGTVHAVDAKCYHQGGPLGEGDIEELGAGNICIKCPWHGYRVCSSHPAITPGSNVPV